MLDEITAKQLEDKEFLKIFINKQIADIAFTVGDGLAINALSGGKDSSAVTMLGHKALSDKLKTYFIDNGLMRQDEPEQVISTFKDLSVHVELVDAKDEFFAALKGKTDPEEKREAITQTFYKDVFGKLVKKSSAKYLLQGTILTDIDETVAGIKRQHNVFEQIGINPQKAFGYKIIEPVVQLRKDGVTIVAKALGLPESIYNRMPFPGPALATRVIGEVTPEKIEIVRKATVITEHELAYTNSFQYMAILHKEELKEAESPSYALARLIGDPIPERVELVDKAAKIVSEIAGEDYLTILHEDKVTGMREGKRNYGLQIGIRNKNKNEQIGKLIPSWETLEKLVKRILIKIPAIVSVNYDITPGFYQEYIDHGLQTEVRCWESIDARTATPTRLPYKTLGELAKRIIAEVPGVVSVTYNITPKPPSTIEAI